MSSTTTTTPRPIYTIAADIRANWGNVYFGAVPYLRAMSELDSVTDKYGMDDADDVIRYFLSNATYWRGTRAREIKAELKALIK